MWSKYFPNANIVGFDIQSFKQPTEKNCSFIKGDQSSREDLKKITDVCSEFDVILEDALHASRHQQITLSFLFPAVKSGGMFIIEDLQTTAKGTDEPTIKRTQELLHILQTTGKWESLLASPEERDYLEKNVANIQFFDSLQFNLGAKHNTDAVAVITKK